MADDTQQWMKLANCRGMDSNLWFPERGAAPRSAKRICGECEVVDECFAYGLRERYGIWGGHGERERRRIRRKKAV